MTPADDAGEPPPKTPRAGGPKPKRKGHATSGTRYGNGNHEGPGYGGPAKGAGRGRPGRRQRPERVGH